MHELVADTPAIGGSEREAFLLRPMQSRRTHIDQSGPSPVDSKIDDHLVFGQFGRKIMACGAGWKSDLLSTC